MIKQWYWGDYKIQQLGTSTHQTNHCLLQLWESLRHVLKVIVWKFARRRFELVVVVVLKEPVESQESGTSLI